MRTRWLHRTLFVAAILSVIGIAAGSGATQTALLVTGESQQAFGRSVSTWARILPDGTVTQVGVTVAYLVILRAPFLDFRGGTGPAQAVAVVGFPAAVQRTTFLNHFEMHWYPAGHPPPGIFDVPHWDLHFYGVSAADVKQVSPANSLPLPAPNRLPQGYGFPPNVQAVPEMGVHAVRAEIRPGYRFNDPEMIVGFHQGQLTFLEPMIPRDWLLRKQDLTMDVPRPQFFGRATRYPTKFRVNFNTEGDAYEIMNSS